MTHTINQIILTAQNYELLHTDLFAAIAIGTGLVVGFVYKESVRAISINEWKKSLRK